MARKLQESSILPLRNSNDEDLIVGEMVFDVQSNDIAIIKQDGTVKTSYDMVKDIIGDDIKKYTTTSNNFSTNIYGIRVDLKETNVFNAVEYTENAYGMKEMYVADDKSICQGSWTDNVLKELFGIRPCILSWDEGSEDAEVLGYLNVEDYTKWNNGSRNIYSSHKGSDTETYNKPIMIEFDKIYYYTILDEYRDTLHIKFSKTKHTLHWKTHPAFIKKSETGTVECDHIYISASQIGIFDRSSTQQASTCATSTITDSYPLNLNTNKLYDVITAVSNIGYTGLDSDNNYNNRWQVLDYNTYSLLTMIMRFTFKIYNLSLLDFFNIDVTDVYRNDGIVENPNKGFFSHSTPYTYNKGLFWRGVAEDGYNSILGDKTCPIYRFPSHKFLGIDNLFGSILTPVLGLSINQNKKFVQLTTESIDNVQVTKEFYTEYLEYAQYPPYTETTSYSNIHLGSLRPIRQGSNFLNYIQINFTSELIYPFVNKNKILYNDTSIYKGINSKINCVTPKELNYVDTEPLTMYLYNNNRMGSGIESIDFRNVYSSMGNALDSKAFIAGIYMQYK